MLVNFVPGRMTEQAHPVVGSLGLPNEICACTMEGALALGMHACCRVQQGTQAAAGPGAAGLQHAERSGRSVPEAQSARLSSPQLKSHATQQSMFSHLSLCGGGALLSPSCVLSHVIMSFRLISAWLASATVCWEAASLLLGMARATVRAIAVTFLPGWPAATAP